MNHLIVTTTNALELLRWTARFLSAISIALILTFFIGEGFQPANVEWKEWIGLLFFPLGVFTGLVIAWRKEGLGGAITLLSLAGFYLLYGLFLSGRFPGGWGFLIFASPGLLFLTHWYLSRHMK